MQSSLSHLGDDAVEDGVLVVQGLAALADSLLSGAEGAEVLDSLGHGVPEETHDDAPLALAVHLDVEVNLVGDGLEAAAGGVSGVLEGLGGVEEEADGAQGQENDTRVLHHLVEISVFNGSLRVCGCSC